MKWVTRERPKIDRIACPWLIRRFVEADGRTCGHNGDNAKGFGRGHDGRDGHRNQDWPHQPL
jgi:Chromate resistance exported protein